MILCLEVVINDSSTNKEGLMCTQSERSENLDGPIQNSRSVLLGDLMKIKHS